MRCFPCKSESFFSVFLKNALEISILLFISEDHDSHKNNIEDIHHPANCWRLLKLKNLSDILGSSVVKNLPANAETQKMWVQSLGQEDPLEEEIATHSSILAWKIPRTEDPGGLWSTESQRVGHD